MSFNKEISPPPYSAVVLAAVPDKPYVKDYLSWSIINLLFGWCFFGVIPLIFSILCRNYKNNQNFASARTMSTFALISNILITTGGLVAWSIFIAFMYLYIIAVDDLIPK